MNIKKESQNSFNSRNMKQILRIKNFLVLFSKQGMAYYCGPKQGLGNECTFDLSIVIFSCFFVLFACNGVTK